MSDINISVTGKKRLKLACTYCDKDIVVIASGGDGSVNLQDNKTVTPSASQQAVSPDSGYGGLLKVTVNGDSNLKAENIKKGVTIFGVTGTYEATGGGDNSGDGGTQKGTITVIDSSCPSDPETYTFEFERGMTWGEFISSDYNDNGHGQKFESGSNYNEEVGDEVEFYCGSTIHTTDYYTNSILTEDITIECW